MAAKPGAVPAQPAPVSPKTARLIKQLQSPVKAERLAAMKELGNQGAAARAAVLPLMERLRREGPEFADQAARTLAQIGPAAVPALIKALADAAPPVRRRALWALAVIGPDAAAAVEPVSDFLEDKDAQVRTLAALALAEIGPESRPAVPRLAKLLRDPDPEARAWAAVALHEIGPEMIEHLLAALKEPDLPVRLSAVQALPRFRDANEAVQALADALRDPDASVRTTAAAALVQLGPEAKAALPGLLACLKEQDRALQATAFTAILLIGSPRDAALRDGLGALNATHSWARPAPVKKAVKRPEQVQRLVGVLGDQDPTRRLAAVLALGQLGPLAKAAVPHLKKCLKDRDLCVRAVALLALPAVDPRQPPGARRPES